MSSELLDRRRPAVVPPELSRFLVALFDPTPGALVDIRVRRGVGAMAQHFLPARGQRAGALIAELGADADVYLGVLPRRRQVGGKDGLMPHGWTLWADCDSAGASGALELFKPAPSLLVASGSRGHRHAYWLLRRPLSIPDIERANRRLAGALGADAGAVTNAATILRPPGTYNFKTRQPRRVRLLEPASMRRYRAAQVVGRLADSEPARPGASGRDGARAVGDDPLLAIAPVDYFRELTGRGPNRTGKLHCPLHPDDTPSLHVYPTPERGWHCYGCNAGGSIYDLAAALWGYRTRGPEFTALRTALRERFGV